MGNLSRRDFLKVVGGAATVVTADQVLGSPFVVRAAEDGSQLVENLYEKQEQSQSTANAIYDIVPNLDNKNVEVFKTSFNRILTTIVKLINANPWVHVENIVIPSDLMGNISYLDFQFPSDSNRNIQLIIQKQSDGEYRMIYQYKYNNGEIVNRAEKRPSLSEKLTNLLSFLQKYTDAVGHNLPIKDIYIVKEQRVEGTTCTLAESKAWNCKTDASSAYVIVPELHINDSDGHLENIVTGARKSKKPYSKAESFPADPAYNKVCLRATPES